MDDKLVEVLGKIEIALNTNAVATKKLEDAFQAALRKFDQMLEWKDSIRQINDNMDYFCKLMETLVYISDEAAAGQKLTKRQFREQLGDVFKMLEGTPAGEILNKFKDTPKFEAKMDEMTKKVFKGQPLSSLFERHAERAERRKSERGG